MSNIQPYIIINGVNSRTISGLLITSLPPISKPQQRTQVETVDGRSGDIITPLGFSAYDKTVSIGLTYNYDIDEVIEFFNTSGTVIFSNEPTKYYRFAIYEQIDFEKLIKFKTAEVVLHVQPYKFSTTEEPLLFNDPTEISVENNGNTDARPNLLITGSGEIDVSLNGSQLLSMDLGEDDQTVIIDSENMNAYGAQSAIREVVTDIEPKQAGSGDPSPDNVREIIGFTEANVSRVGVNLWNEEWEVGSININTGANNNYGERIRSKGYIPIKPLTSYFLVYGGEAPANSFSNILFYDEDKTYLGSNTYVYRGLNNNTPFNTPVNAYYARFVIEDYTTEYHNNVSFNYPSSETDYHAYNGLIKNIAFTDGDNPLTVYGGKLNVTTGELTITWGAVDLGSLSYTKTTVSDYTVFWANITDKAQNTNSLCESYKNSNNGRDNLLDNEYGTYNLASLKNTIAIRDDAKASLSVSDFKTAMNGIMFAYELATPIVYQLTPTQINNLLGLNNLYSDTGDLSVKYKSGGVIQTQTGDIVTFTVGVGDMDKGTLLNRLITGNYDKIRLKKGDNVISFTGNVKQVSIDKYSRWI